MKILSIIYKTINFMNLPQEEQEDLQPRNIARSRSLSVMATYFDLLPIIAGILSFY